MRLILICLFVIYCNYGSAQSKKIKVLNTNDIKYYKVYKALDLSTNDSLILLGCKANNKDFSEVELTVGEFYTVDTRLNSHIKVEEDNYLFLHHGITMIQNIQISNKGSLPVLILSYEAIIRKDE